MLLYDQLRIDLGTHLFVKVPRPGDSERTFSVSTRRQRKDLFGLRVKLPPVTTSLTTQKVEAIPLSALPKDKTSELADLILH